MNLNEKNFLTLLNNGFFNQTTSVDFVDDVMFEMAKTHKCVPFIYMGAKNVGIELAGEWKKFMTINAIRNQLYMQIQDDVLRTLKDAEIPCVILKGSSVSVNYPEPMARPMGDIDILVKEEFYSDAIKRFGYDESENDHDFHYGFNLNGITIEIHKYVSEYSSEKYGEYIKKTMDKALDCVVTKNIDEFEFPALSDEYQAASLLLHMQRHFFENLLPLRMLCDWVMFVKSVDTTTWKDKVYPFISKMGLASFCDALVFLCDKYFSSDFSEKIFVLPDEKVADDIILEFFNGGINKKDDAISRGVAAKYSENRTKSKGKIMPLIMFLNKTAIDEFVLAKKSKIFLPIFWFYIPFRYLVRIMIGKRSAFKFEAFHDTAERKEYIIKKLNLKD